MHYVLPDSQSFTKYSVIGMWPNVVHIWCISGGSDGDIFLVWQCLTHSNDTSYAEVCDCSWCLDEHVHLERETPNFLCALNFLCL